MFRKAKHSKKEKVNVLNNEKTFIFAVFSYKCGKIFVRYV